MKLILLNPHRDGNIFTNEEIDHRIDEKERFAISRFLCPINIRRVMTYKDKVLELIEPYITGVCTFVGVYYDIKNGSLIFDFTPFPLGDRVRFILAGDDHVEDASSLLDTIVETFYNKTF